MFLKANYYLIVTLCFFSSHLVYPQNELYTPLNIQRAYEKGTRNLDGTPGANYWQNSADYIIEAELDTRTGIISGKEQITYYNNSPDSLTKIVIRLYQDMYKYGALRDFQLSESSLTDGVKIKNINIDGEEIDLSDAKRGRRYGTNISLFPASSIKPDSKTSIDIEWSFKMPGGSPIRMGTYDSTIYFVAYWYPQISVYDDIDGWDEYNFGGMHEFYNDFNNFDVKITVPAAQGIWATGELQNPEAVLQPEIYERFKTALVSDTVINIVANKDLDGKVYKDDKAKNTWHFIARDIPDFAFATSDRYLWDGLSYEPENGSGRRVFLSAVYNPTSEDFYHVAAITRDAVEYFSTILPAVPFPYPSLTVFNGSGGMEFPMIINDGSEKDIAAAARLTSHEVTHQYFPFLTGMNEKKYAWMDEGMAVMVPFDFQERYGVSQRQKNIKLFEAFAGEETEMPLIIPSIMTSGSAYRFAAYGRSSIAFSLLENTLGKDLFREALKEFTKRWRGKHPIPYDFFYTFDAIAGEDLSWFWIPWFFERGYPDLAVKSVSSNNNTLRVSVENIGSFPVPIHLTVEGNDGNTKEIFRDASVWKEADKLIIIEEEIDFQPLNIKLGSDLIPDVNQENNFYYMR